MTAIVFLDATLHPDLFEMMLAHSLDSATPTKREKEATQQTGNKLTCYPKLVRLLISRRQCVVAIQVGWK